MSPEPGHAIFHGEGGYEFQRHDAGKILEVGKPYRVVGGSVGQSMTYLKLDGVAGEFNSVMFHCDTATCPLQDPYAALDQPPRSGEEFRITNPDGSAGAKVVFTKREPDDLDRAFAEPLPATPEGASPTPRSFQIVDDVRMGKTGYLPELQKLETELTAAQAREDSLRDFINKMDGIIEEVGGVTASCINPYEDLKRALLGQKEKADSFEKKLTAAQAEISGLKSHFELVRDDRNRAVAYAKRIERGEVKFTSLAQKELEKILTLGLEKDINEGLGDVVVRTVTDLKAEIAELKSIVTEKRPLADCYERVCQTFGIEGDIIGFVRGKEAEIGRLRGALLNAKYDFLRIKRDPEVSWTASHVTHSAGIAIDKALKPAAPDTPKQ